MKPGFSVDTSQEPRGQHQGRDEEGDVVQRQPGCPPRTKRNQWSSVDRVPGGVLFWAPAEGFVTRMDMACGIVGLPRQHADLAACFSKRKRHIVNVKRFWPVVLAEDQDAHASNCSTNSDGEKKLLAGLS